jgi:hypothetical protein
VSALERKAEEPGVGGFDRSLGRPGVAAAAPVGPGGDEVKEGGEREA